MTDFDNNKNNDDIQFAGESSDEKIVVKHINCSCFPCFVICSFGLLIAFLLLVWYFYKMPGMNDLLVCRMNIQELGEAIERYYDVNDTYPKSLDELRGEYLKDSAILSCPSNTKKVYSYTRPDEKTSGSFRIIECTHTLRSDLPAIKLVLTKDGNIKTIADGRSKKNNAGK